MKKTGIPRYQKRMLSRFAEDMVYDSILEDLEYRLLKRSSSGGPGSRIRSFFQFIVILFPFLIQEAIGAASMFMNNLKIAFRNLTRHPMYSAIKIGGLAAALVCVLLILQWVGDELSYDRFHHDAKLLYRMNWDFKLENSEGVGPGTPPPLAGKLAREIPGILASVRLRNMANTVVRSHDKFFSENGILAADSNIFDLFSFPMLRGDPKTALLKPNSVVLTEETAQKYFGNEPALGRFLTIGEKVQDLYGTYQDLFTVTGIVENPPHNSHIQFDMLTSMSSYPEVAWRDWSWIWMQMATYVKLEPSASAPIVEARVQEMVKKYLSASKRGISYDEIIRNNWRWNFVLQPMTDVYLRSENVGNRLGPAGNHVYVYLFAMIASFVLLIACVNFTNLATAQSSSRAREVGIRKVLGSEKRMLVAQFLVESLLFSLLAMLLALVLAKALIRPFGVLSGKVLDFNFLTPFWIPIALVLLTVFVALVAGGYPSFYLSSFLPGHALKKGPIRLHSRRWSLRNILVLFQFTVTIGLITCTILVQRQLTYIGSADLGFKKDGLVIISNMNNRLEGQIEAFKARLKSHPQIINASVSTGVPSYWGFQDTYRAEGHGDKAIDLISYMTDEDFISTLGIEIIRGRGFSKEFFSNASGVILNEAAVKYLGWKNPLGKTITYPGGSGIFQVIGVMKDANFITLHSPITPFALFHHASKTYQIPNSIIVVRISRNDVEGCIELLKSEWKAVAPTVPFEYQFLDERLESQYRSEHRFGEVFLVFSLLTIMIACIGLLGLVSFSTQRRTKEVGIRKVLGASAAHVVSLISKEFIGLVAISNLIAWPIAYFAMNRWLHNFTYRVEIRGWEFALAGGATLLIALLTMIVLALKAALANPMDALRYE